MRAMQARWEGFWTIGAGEMTVQPDFRQERRGGRRRGAAGKEAEAFAVCIVCCCRGAAGPAAKCLIRQLWAPTPPHPTPAYPTFSSSGAQDPPWVVVHWSVHPSFPPPSMDAPPCVLCRCTLCPRSLLQTPRPLLHAGTSACSRSIRPPPATWTMRCQARREEAVVGYGDWEDSSLSLTCATGFRA